MTEATSGVISFDLDGTLINGPFSRVLSDLQQVLAEEGITHTKSEILQRHRDLLITDPLAAYDWDSIVADRLAAVGVEQPFDLVDRLEVHVRRNETQLLHQHTFASLDRLRSAGWRVVVLTNGWRRYQEPILRGIGLLDVIDQLLAADDIGEPKPSPAAFAAVRGAADDHVHVGDRIDHDIIGGKAAGARTVLISADVPIRGSAEEADADLMNYLEKLAVQQRVPAVQPPELMIPDFFAADLTDIVNWLT